MLGILGWAGGCVMGTFSCDLPIGNKLGGKMVGDEGLVRKLCSGH